MGRNRTEVGEIQMHGSLKRGTVLLAVCWLAIHAFSAMASTALSLPNVDLRHGGTVVAIVQQPNGGVVIGGSFTFVDGQSRQNIARLLPDGSLDPDWNPGADAEVITLAVDESGSIYAGGFFRNVGGQSRRGLAKISGDGFGVVDPDWNPLFATWVSPVHYFKVLGIGPDNKLYVSGDFNTIGGQQVSGLARLALDGAGSADPLWNPISGGVVGSAAFDQNGHVFAAFELQLAKISLAENGQIDSSWAPEIFGYFRKIVMGGDGNLYVSGRLEVPGSPVYFHELTRVSVAGQGQVDHDWLSESLCCVDEMAADTLGNLYVSAVLPDSDGEFTRPSLVRISMADGAFDDSWMTGIEIRDSDRIFALMPAIDGGLHVGGGLFKVGAELHMGYLVLGSDAQLVDAKDAHSNPIIRSIARQPDGGTIVAGSFLKADGLARNGILRILADGNIDSIWDPLNGVTGRVDGLSVDSKGDVYAFGSFGRIVDGVPGPPPEIVKIDGSGTGQIDIGWNAPRGSRISAIVVGPGDDLFAGGAFPVEGSLFPKSLAKLRSADGGADPLWNPEPNGPVSALAIGNDGELVVAGEFSTIAGGNRSGLAKISRQGHGALNPGWIPGPVSGVSRLATDTDGRVYLGGSFTTVAGASIARLARVSGDDGALDTVWNPSPDSEVLSMHISADDSVFVAGYFSMIGGAERHLIAKLDASSDVGAADYSWDAQADGPVRAITDGGNSSILVGGYFEEMGGERRNSLAALRDGTDSIFSDGFE